MKIFKIKTVRVFFCAAVLAVLCGCHHPEAKIPELHPEVWTPSQVENLFTDDDPLEPFNRTMFTCTDFLMDYVADPLGRVYTTIFPRPFIRHFNNVCVNLEYPARVISCLLQAEWGGAGNETIRFFANSTLGIAGIFDVAEYWWQIPSTEADFGQAFARWGIGPGHSLMLPVSGSGNGRDLLGSLFDIAFDLKTYIPYAGYATFLNRMVIAHRDYDRAVGDSLDPYKDFRLLMSVRRQLQLRMWPYKFKLQMAQNAKVAAEQKKSAVPMPPIPQKPSELKAPFLALNGYFSQNNVSDTLRVTMFQVQNNRSFWYMPLSWLNRDFSKISSIRRIQLRADRPKAYYNFWQAKKSADKVPRKERLVLLLPGIGGMCTTSTVEALAELFYEQYCHVATFDSSFNWRFITADSKCRLPGYLPDDAQRVRNYLRAAIDDLKEDGKIDDPEIIVAGYSMGGLQTLKIAELEDVMPILNVSRYVAINPPVSIGHAIKKIDELAASSANWTKTQMIEKLVSGSGQAMAVISRSYDSFDPAAGAVEGLAYRMPFDDVIAKCIAGLYLKLPLRDMIFTAHRENPLPGLPDYSWGRRNDLYLAIDKLTMEKYAREYLAPTYKGKTYEKLAADSSLTASGKFLKASPKLRVLHNVDDFLLSAADRQWLDKTFGERLLWISNGGHLGSLYYVPVQKAIIKAALGDG